MGNHTEFRRGVELLQSELDFDQDRNVSVFETNIRVVGGLLSSHLMAKEMCDQHGCVGSQRGTAVSSALPVPPLPPLTPFPTLGNRGTKTSCSTWPWTSRSASCQRLTPPRVRLPTTAPPPPRSTGSDVVPWATHIRRHTLRHCQPPLRRAAGRDGHFQLGRRRHAPA